MSIRKVTRDAVAASVLALAASRALAQSSTFSNPISPNGADPYVLLYDGNYYYTDTTGNNVSIAESSTLPGIGSAPMNAVYTPPSGYGNVWAPEIQNIGGTWYIYFAMGPSSNTNNQRTYVLKGTTSSPLGPYTYAGQIDDPTNDWAIDPTVLNSGGSQYLIWSGWAGTANVQQNLYIAPMTSPTTLGSRVLISSPTNSWETQGAPPAVNEGPVTLTSPGGTTTVIFSASGSWTNDYCLGQLELTGSNPLNPSDWTKDNAGPVFQSGNNIWAPGHSSYTTSDNGTRNWIVYHAADYYNAGWDREILTQPFSFNPDGTPSFGQPVPVTVPIQWGPTSWIGAINESNNDTVHDYLNPANWVNGVVTDSFANVTITDNTTLYLSADHATTGDIVFTYGSGQMFLSFQSNNATNRTWTMNGNMDVNVLGGDNNIYISTPARPVTLALGSTQRTFNISSTGTVWIQGGLTGTAGLNLTGGGELILQGAKTYSGPTVITQGILSAGDGTTASSVANLPASTVVSIGPAGTLLMPGLAAGGADETIAGLTGSGTVSGPTDAVTLTIASAATNSFSGSLTGSQLSLTEAGPATQILSGTSTYTGLTMVTGGTLQITGGITATSGLRLTGGSVVINGGGFVTATGFSSAGLNAGTTGNFTVGGGSNTGTGSLTVQGDFNIGDNGTGTLSLLTGGTVQAETFYVGKYASAKGTVNQTGGALASIPAGGDWQIGGANASAAAAVGVYNISGGSVNDANNFQIGTYGTGTINQTGGTVTDGAYLSIGRYPGSTGFYNISAGNLVSTGLLLIVGEQGNGTLNLSGTGNITAVALSVGLNGGIGKFDQTGGTITATDGVELAQNTGGTGAYILSGGTLITPSIAVGSGTGTFTADGGTLEPTTTTDPLAGFSTITDRGGMVFNTNGLNVTFTPVLVHDNTLPGVDGGVTKTGAGTLTLTASESYTGNTNVLGGTLAYSADTATAPLVRAVGKLSIGTGATFVASSPAGAAPQSSGTPAGRTLILATALSDTGTLDLSDADLDVRGGSISAITALVASGYNETGGGNWTGTGITSSTAAADGTHLTAVGVILDGTPSGLVRTTLDGQPLSATDVIARYTYFGDANLDGKVDGSDYSLIDTGFASRGTLTGWYYGDFNYDGVIDGSDYALIDNAFNNQTGQLAVGSTSVLVADATAQVADVPVPEPASLGVLVAGIGLVSNRRRR